MFFFIFLIFFDIFFFIFHISPVANFVCVSLPLPFKISRSKKPPRLPSFATFDSQDVIAEDDEEDDIEVARQLADDWEV